jgi:hypothetical protein
MSLAAPRIREGVDYPVCRGIDFDGEPCCGLRLGLGKRQGAREKSGELAFLAWPGHERDQQSYSDHLLSPSFRGPAWSRRADVRPGTHYGQY